MLKQAENIVKIEGILSEIDIKEREGREPNNPYISGQIKLRVRQTINGKATLNEIPVHMFSSKLTKAGKENPAYASIKKMTENFTSIAAAGSEEGADTVSINGASIRSNDFWGNNGQLVSYPRINASFIDRVNKADSRHMAEFTTVIVIMGIKDEVNREEEPTGRKIVRGVIVQYNGLADVVDFIVESQPAIDHIESNWKSGDTVKVKGRINFTIKTETVEEKLGFGEPDIKERTVTVRELIITGGSGEAFDDDSAYNEAEIKKALGERKARLDEAKEAAERKAASSGTKSFDSSDVLGF